MVRVISALGHGSGDASSRQSQVQQLLENSSAYTPGLPRLGLQKWTVARNRVRHLLTVSIQVLKPFGYSGVQRAIQVLDSSQTNPSGLVAQVTDAIVRTFITPTQLVNHRLTDRRVRAAEARVRPITATIPAGTVVVQRGQLITPTIYQRLKAVRLPSPGQNWGQHAAAAVFAAVLVGLTFWYLWSFYPEVTGNQSLMLLLDTTTLVAGLAGRVFVPGHSVLPYFFPLAGAAALSGLLISSEVGVALAVMLALLVGWLAAESLPLVSYFLLTGVTGAMAVRRLRRLNDFLVIGAAVTGVAVLVIVAFHLAGSQPWTLIFGRDYGIAAIVNGLISAAIAFGGFVLLGNSFGVTTSLHLLELGHPDRPLLRRLMADAPGTYNHSLVVASMVERAAQEIDANVLLARVMALYHDIGKIANPLCFIENQIGTSNIHDDLMPQESAEIIRAHVTHGALLARQHRLPAPIRDGILQHHGTMTMAYFFHRALEADPNTDAAVYSYPGPRPHTREAALLMLADGCEGAVRALPAKSPEAIRDIVNQIVDERVATGQLSRCSLTLRDLSVIRVALVEVLNGIYHPRVEYPARVGRPSGE